MIEHIFSRFLALSYFWILGLWCDYVFNLVLKQFSIYDSFSGWESKKFIWKFCCPGTLPYDVPSHKKCHFSTYRKATQKSIDLELSSKNFSCTHGVLKIFFISENAKKRAHSRIDILRLISAIRSWSQLHDCAIFWAIFARSRSLNFAIAITLRSFFTSDDRRSPRDC